MKLDDNSLNIPFYFLDIKRQNIKRQRKEQNNTQKSSPCQEKSNRRQREKQKPNSTWIES